MHNDFSVKYAVTEDKQELEQTPPPKDTIKQVRVKSIEEYLSAIDHAFSILCDPGTENKCTLWFRGQAQEGFDLLPTITRKKKDLQLNPLYETAFLSKFKSLAIPYVERLPAFPLPGGVTSYWSWLFMLRHYELPARILDWSSDALTALFFATDPTDPSLKKGIDASVWVLNPVTLNEAFSFHSYLKPGYIPNVEEESFNLYFGPDSNILNSTKPAAAIGPNNTTRIVAQKGTFTVFPRVKDLVGLNKQPDSSDYLYKINIAWEDFEKIQNQLEHFGITRLSLYPDITSIAAEVFNQVINEGIRTN
ncbi:FRG domain-containing protein [Anaeromicropila herbilytica]|uniref:FRG domain-containing protein n=1 Tax=Anaeromicropila herbilytica TaxID=2785025 RepID=A0A7R7IB22_9FIRM|nr:FRG domain-containing protein [Anaeromicropila herbilytica]BCN29077.1 hypothetical protein bsdtb5_03720 [Anaeromicropila herbilytica]